MKWSVSAWIAVLCLAFGALPARAQSTSYVSATKFASLQDRLDQVEAELARFRNADGGVSSCCDDGGCDAWPCYTPGLVFGAELTFLRPFQSEGQMAGFDYTAAPRLWIGWQNSNGLGVRFRWFEYDGSGADASSQYTDVGMETMDLEVTDTFTLGKKWNGLLSAGVRYAEYDERSAGGGILETDGALGLVVGAELYRALTCNLYLFGIGRTAFMYTDKTNDLGSPNPDSTFSISELQVGVEYRRYLSGTTRLFARAAVEGQYWAGVSDGDTEDTSLIGGVFAIGLAR